MLKKVAIKNLRPNPFRRLEEYPIDREKVDRLKLSIECTGFWTSIIGRPAGKGLIEIAFGHHRLTALLEMFGPDVEVEIIVRELSNEDMLRMMANENMAEWGSNGWVEVETIRATIEAYGNDLIKLPEAAEKTRKDLIRHVDGNSHPHPYTKMAVASFLGWTDKKDNRLQPNDACKTAFAAIDAMDAELVKSDDLRGLARYKIEAICRNALNVLEAEKAEAEQQRRNAEEARKQATAAPTPVDRQKFERQAAVFERQAKQHGDGATERAKRYVDIAAPRLRDTKDARNDLLEMRDVARAMMPEPVVKTKDLRVDDYADKLASRLERIADGDDEISKFVKDLKAWKADLSPKHAEQLGYSFSSLIDRLERMRDFFVSHSGSN